MSTIQEHQKKQLSFEEICPKWAKVIPQLKLKGIATVEGHLDICNSRCCIVGEAHGFKNNYWLPIDVEYCRECDLFSGEFCHPDRVEKTKIAFTQHWNEVHLNK